MAHLFRTSTTSNKKNHQHHNGNGSSNEDAKIYNHKMTNGQQSRRNTMHPRARDSVISTGCSDRSSSISDESFFPSEMEDHTFLMDTCNMESLMRSALITCSVRSNHVITANFVLIIIITSYFRIIIRLFAPAITGSPLCKNATSWKDQPFTVTVLGRVVVYNNVTSSGVHGLTVFGKHTQWQTTYFKLASSQQW